MGAGPSINTGSGNDTNTGTEPGPGTGVGPAADAGTAPCRDPGNGHCCDPGNEPWCDPGRDPCADAGAILAETLARHGCLVRLWVYLISITFLVSVVSPNANRQKYTPGGRSLPSASLPYQKNSVSSSLATCML
jgi:hypothetical protein